MAGRIPREFIDSLIARIDIVDVVQARVPLTKAGRDYKARCPFHEEKSPSFTVSQTKQFYHCFGCGAHGNVIGFVMEFDGLEYPEAIEDLAASMGLDVPREAGFSASADPAREKQNKENSQQLLDLLEAANTFYKKSLRTHSDAESAKNYLRGRGMSGETASKFEIGYAPPGWDNLLRAIGADGALTANLRSAGLISDGDKTYDRFRDRIMFPIRNRRGHCIGFGGRTLGDDTPKYLNSPETPVFHKGSELYGLYNVRDKRKAPEVLLVVEGYMDVVMLAEYGIDYAVASLGTACTPDQVRLLLRTAQRIVYCFDGDNAGRRAAWRALENSLALLREGAEIRFLFLPDGEDPDSLVQAEGREQFEARIGKATPLSDYLFQTLLEENDNQTAESRARLHDRGSALLAQIPPGSLKDLLDERLGDLTRISSSRQRSGSNPDTDQAQSRRAAARAGKRAQRAHSSPQTPVRRALRMLLLHPQLAVRVGEGKLLFPDGLPGANMLKQVIQIGQANPTLSSGQLLEHFRDDADGRHLTKLLDPEDPLAEKPDEALVELEGCLTLIAEQLQQQRFESLAAREKHGLLSDSEKTELLQLAMRR